MTLHAAFFFFFFFNDTATTEIYTLSLHDALPISAARRCWPCWSSRPALTKRPTLTPPRSWRDRKSTRLNSSHLVISYAVFCLKKKKKIKYIHTPYKSRRIRDHPLLQFIHVNSATA